MSLHHSHLLRGEQVKVHFMKTQETTPILPRHCCKNQPEAFPPFFSVPPLLKHCFINLPLPCGFLRRNPMIPNCPQKPIAIDIPIIPSQNDQSCSPLFLDPTLNILKESCPSAEHTGQDSEISQRLCSRALWVCLSMCVTLRSYLISLNFRFLLCKITLLGESNELIYLRHLGQCWYTDMDGWIDRQKGDRQADKQLGSLVSVAFILHLVISYMKGTMDIKTAKT